MGAVALRGRGQQGAATPGARGGDTMGEKGENKLGKMHENRKIGRGTSRGLSALRLTAHLYIEEMSMYTSHRLAAEAAAAEATASGCSQLCNSSPMFCGVVNLF